MLSKTYMILNSKTLNERNFHCYIKAIAASRLPTFPDDDDILLKAYVKNTLDRENTAEQSLKSFINAFS